MPIEVTPNRVRAARILAVVADAVQLAGIPVFGPGFASPANDVLDVVVGGVLVWLVGFHWSFLPGFLAELVPGVDLVPTWTAAVLLATRGQGAAVLEPEPEREPREMKNVTPGKR
jgi:hypothetical protein